jgi:hypothetical protein
MVFVPFPERIDVRVNDAPGATLYTLHIER